MNGWVKAGLKLFLLGPFMVGLWLWYLSCFVIMLNDIIVCMLKTFVFQFKSFLTITMLTQVAVLVTDYIPAVEVSNMAGLSLPIL